MTVDGASRTGTGGPLVPSGIARSAVRPLGHHDVTLSPDGWLGAWQRRTAEVTIPHVLDRIEQGEATGNLTRLLDGGEPPLRGMTFSDSDVHKTLEAIAWAAALPDPGGTRLARGERLAGLLARVQEPDGYLNSWVQGSAGLARWSDPQSGHELYTAGHLFQAAVAAERTGTLPQLPEVATRLADLLVRRFGDDPDYVDGHPQVETALVELYRTTGRASYLELARRQLEQRGAGWLGEGRFSSAYFQDRVPLRKAGSATGHAVRQLYLLAGAVDVAVETHDAELLAAAVRIWEDLMATKTYVTGAHGSRHRDEAIGDPYELPPDRAYAETCAAIASFQLAWRLLLATGEARYADAMETVLYNAVAVSTSAGGDRFFYANPLHLRTGHEGDEDAPSRRLSWFSCACCPPNLARLLASVHDYLITRTSDGIQLQHPAAGRAEVALADGRVELRLATGYPYDGQLRLSVETGIRPPWELALRVPAWCETWSMTIDGQPQDVPAPDGYLRLRRSWQGRHEIELDLAMPVRTLVAHPRIDAVRGCVALARGPLLYALEEADLPAGVVLEDARLLGVGRPRPSGEGPAPILIDARFTAAAPVLPPYRPAEPGPRPGTQPFDTVLIPYHRWANRSPGAMRVWLPLADPSA